MLWFVDTAGSPDALQTPSVYLSITLSFLLLNI